MLSTFVIVLGSIIITLFLGAGILYVVSKWCKIATPSYGKSIVVVAVLLVTFSVVAIICKAIGLQLSWSIAIIEIILCYPGFSFLYRKYYQTSYGKIIGIYGLVLVFYSILITLILVVVGVYSYGFGTSKDYIDPGLRIITNISSDVVWGSRKEISFSISNNPIFKQYGYDKPQIIKGDEVLAIPNNSSNLFAAHTIGQWGTDTNPSEGYASSSVIIFNKDLSIFKVVPLPQETEPCCDAALAWVGDRFIFANERDAYVQSSEYGNHYYILDVNSNNPIFETIMTPEALKKDDYIDPVLYSQPSEQIAAMSYCLVTVQLYDSHYCSQSGVSIITSSKIEEIIRKNTRDTFEVGWDMKNLYIREIDQNSETQAIYDYPLVQVQSIE